MAEENKTTKPDALKDFLGRLLRVPKVEIDALEAKRPKRKKGKQPAA